MKKRLMYTFTIMILLAIIISNLYFEIQYDINVIEYFSNSSKLTKEEEDWLIEHGKIIYGSDQSSPPLRYIDERTGQYSGLVVDYIRALSIELKTEISFEPVQLWGDALDSIKNSEKDFFDMIASTDRAKQFLFSNPIYSLRGTILIPKSTNDINKYEDLNKKKVAITKADYAAEFLREKVSDIDYVFTSDMTSALLMLQDGRVDAVVGDEPVITYLNDYLNMKDNFKTIDEPIYEKDCVLAVPKSEKILVSILNKGIYNLKKKKVMANIQEKWFGISGSFAKEDISGKILLLVISFIIILILFIYISYLWNKRLKKEVKKRTEELYLSRHDLQVTFDGLTHLMIVIDKDYTILNINNAFCKLFKLEKDCVIGKNCMDFEKILYGHNLETIIKQTFLYGERNQKEFEYRNRSYNISTFPLDDKMENTQKILIMVKDITKIKIADQQMLQNSKMLAIGELAAGVAHEIRNPLGIIRNYCYILKTNHNKDEERVKKSIAVIESSVVRASDIIDNLLNFSRISSNEKKETNIKEFITKILLLEQKHFQKKNINYDIICSEDFICYTKEESLKHIFVNIISNAVDAMPNGGLFKIKCAKKDGNLSIICSDTGTGISKEDLERIFNPFFTTKIPGKGTGLGLYIVYNEVSNYGGVINVTSELGKGTSFNIMLPLGEEENDELR